MAILFEQAAIDTGGNAVVRRFGGTAFMTAPTDQPANTPYMPLIRSAGSFERHCWGRGSTTGRSAAGFGVMRIANDKTSGTWALDPYVKDAVDGQPFVIRSGDGNSLSGFSVLATGITKQVLPGWDYLDYVLNDQASFLWDLPLQQTKYLGTNVGGTGLEGLATDIIGAPKPILTGYVQNISPPLANAVGLIYQVDDGGAKLPMTITVYSSRNVVTAGTQRATLALLISNTPTASTYDWYAGPEGWYVKLGGGIVGRITCDVSEGAAADRTIAQVTSRLITRVAANYPGYSVPFIDGIAAMDGKFSAEVGNWCFSETTLGAFLDPILASGGCYLADRRVKGLLIGRLEDPDALPSVATFAEWQLWNMAVAPPNDSGIGLRVGSTGAGVFASNAIYSSQGTIAGLPPWRVRLDYSQNFTIMTKTDLPADTDADIAFCKDQFRTITVQDSTILATHLKAPEFDLTTLLRYQTDATTEAARLLNLRKVQRVVVTIQVESGMATGIELGSVFTLQIARFGWDNGRNFFCLGIIENYGDASTAASTTLIGWGLL